MIQDGGGTPIGSQVFIMVFLTVTKNQMVIILQINQMEMLIGEVDGGMVHLVDMTVMLMLTLGFLTIIMSISQIITTQAVALTMCIRLLIILVELVRDMLQTGIIIQWIRHHILIQTDIGLEVQVE